MEQVKYTRYSACDFALRESMANNKISFCMWAFFDILRCHLSFYRGILPDDSEVWTGNIQENAIKEIEEFVDNPDVVVTDYQIGYVHAVGITLDRHASGFIDLIGDQNALILH